MSSSRTQLENYLKRLEIKADSVLDIGGSQLPVKNRVRSWSVKDYKILDIAEPHEVKQKPDLIADIQSYSDITSLNKSFDLAFCLEVAEYWHNPLAALVNIHYLLKDNGILYISFPFIYPHHRPDGLDYLRYTKWGCQKLLKESGFEILEEIPKVAFDGYRFLLTFFSQEGLRHSKNYLGHDEIGYIYKVRKN